MTERLYYTDSYCSQFQAHIRERLVFAGQPAVVLDATCFYPTSGGQPADRGSLGGVPVVDVLVREEDQAVVHVLAAEPPPAAEVSGEIEWPRRFDHMQQHTGQHILSQAFLRLLGAETVGFHLGPEQSTLDLQPGDWGQDQVEAAERLANEVVWRDLAVQATFVEPAQAASLPLRKIPEGLAGPIRLVTIGDFDTTACGGTHVARAGEVGLIKVVKMERRGPEMRLTFLCGGRALADYQQKNRILLELAADLTVGYWQVGEAVARLAEENRQRRRLLQRQRGELLRLEAETLLMSQGPTGETKVITRVFEGRDAEEVRGLANELARQPDLVALLGLAGKNARLVFCRGAAAPGNMSALLKAVLPLLGPARGGGTLTFAQGGGPAADVATVARALHQARALLPASSPKP